MEPKAPILERERRNLAFFATLPDNRPAGHETSLVRGIQYLTPLFEYSGACAGCGETPYLQLLTQLFGDRLLVANATGVSNAATVFADPHGPTRCSRTTRSSGSATGSRWTSIANRP